MGHASFICKSPSAPSVLLFMARMQITAENEAGIGKAVQGGREGAECDAARL